MKKVGSFAAESQGFYRFLWEIVTLQAWSKSDSFLSQENHFKKQLALFNRWTILWPKSIKIVHLVFYESFYRFLWEIVTLQAWSKSDSFLSQENHFKKQLALFNRWTILWPKSIKIVHLVFYESFNRWQNKYSDRFLLEKRREAMDHWCCLIYLRFSIASW